MIKVVAISSCGCIQTLQLEQQQQHIVKTQYLIVRIDDIICAKPITYSLYHMALSSIELCEERIMRVSDYAAIRICL